MSIFLILHTAAILLYFSKFNKIAILIDFDWKISKINRNHERKKMLEQGCYIKTDEIKNFEPIILVQSAGDIAFVRYRAMRVSDEKPLWVGVYVSTEGISFESKPDEISKKVLELDPKDVYGTGEINTKKNKP